MTPLCKDRYRTYRSVGADAPMWLCSGRGPRNRSSAAGLGLTKQSIADKPKRTIASAGP